MNHLLPKSAKVGEFSWEGGHGLFLRMSAGEDLQPGDNVGIIGGSLLRAVQAFVHHKFPGLTVARVERTTRTQIGGW